MSLPTDKQARKETPIYSGVLKYFPDALAEVARVSFIGNRQHNPGEPLHWAKEKSQDEPDACVRHLLESVTEDGMPALDEDGTYHAAKAAWRALAHLQRLLDKVQARAQEKVEDGELVVCDHLPEIEHAASSQCANPRRARK